jgi:hypothetical protein
MIVRAIIACMYFLREFNLKIFVARIITIIEIIIPNRLKTGRVPINIIDTLNEANEK